MALIAPVKLFEGTDLVLFYREPSAITADGVGVVFLTFAAWSATGVGAPFADSFFQSRGIRSLQLVQKRNHWWHTQEIYHVRDCVLGLAQEQSSRLVLYGSSMGGYGSFHLQREFQAWRSFSIAPQLTVNSESVPGDRRWQKEWSAIEREFDEKLAFTWAPPGGCFIFMDCSHEQDSLHALYFDRHNSVDSNVIINVPHTLHDCARVLVKSEDFKLLLLSKELIDGKALSAIREKFASLFKENPKTLLNFLRRNSTLDEHYTVEGIVNLLNRNDNLLDFEAMYFAAAFFLRIGNPELALYYSKRSIEKYPRSPIPEYLLRKHDNVLASLAALGFARNKLQPKD